MRLHRALSSGAETVLHQSCSWEATGQSVRAKGDKGNEVPFGTNLMPAPRLHLGGKVQPPQREKVVSHVSELLGLCQLSRRPSKDCQPTESA